jgi:DNA-directed RNA polymerase specialized sigma24 family protein
MMTEPALLDRLHLGEDAAYEQVVRGHIGPMLFVARRLLRDEQRARLVVQSAFLAAFRDLPECGSTVPLSSWLLRHLIHEAVRQLRPGMLPAGRGLGGAAFPVKGAVALPLP